MSSSTINATRSTLGADADSLSVMRSTMNEPVLAYHAPSGLRMYLP